MKTAIIKGVSARTGNPYTAIDVYLTERYKKRIFLHGFEIRLATETECENDNT